MLLSSSTPSVNIPEMSNKQQPEINRQILAKSDEVFFGEYLPLLEKRANVRQFFDPSMDTDDLVQEVSLSLLRQQRKHDCYPDTPESAITRITQFRAIDMFRSTSQTRGATESFADMTPFESSYEDTSESATTFSERIGRLISPLSAEVFTLHYFFGMTLAEISENRQRPLSTVKKQLLSGQRKLRQEFTSRQDLADELDAAC